ncbi:MAG: Dickkopf N-terminal cysteine-rich domain-containing protein [Gemmatimonadales bacterium]
MRLPKSTAPILRMANCVNLPAPLLLAQEALDDSYPNCYTDCDCYSNQYCSSATSRGCSNGYTGTCTGDFGYGHGCNRNNQCGTGLACSNGRCQ